jgi:hypothetical protein
MRLSISIFSIALSVLSFGTSVTCIGGRPVTQLSDFSEVTDHQLQHEGQLPESGRFKLPGFWRDLIPLQATREKVERVLGRPRSSEGSRHIYENDTERVDVVYSAGRCEAVAGRWNVAAEVVILVDVYPKKSLFLEDIIFDKQKFIRHTWSHPEDWVTYRNKEDGIEIECINYGKNAEEVRRFSFGPKAKDSNLRCNN